VTPTRRGVLAGMASLWALPAWAASATRLVAVHAPGTLDPHRALHPVDGPTATYGDLVVGIDAETPATQAFFGAHAARVAVLRGLHLGTEDPLRGRRLALTGRPDPAQPDIVTRLGLAADFGSDGAGGAWKLGRRLSLGGLVDPSRDGGAAPWFAPSDADRASIDAWLADRGHIPPADPGPTPRPRAPGATATLADDAALVPGLLDRFRGVRLVGPDAETGLSELWTGLDALLTALADSGWLDTTLVLLTADRGRDLDGVPSASAATLVAGGPVRGGRAWDVTDGTDLVTGGPGVSRPGWAELVAGSLAACGRTGALPGVPAWTAWWA
jgi:hypothetical protein